MDNRQAPGGGAADHALTLAEEREIAIELSSNPIVKEICEAITLFQCTGSLDGFSAENRYIKQHLGEDGLRRWSVIAKKMTEALLDATQ